MSKINLQNREWCELVFENRNQTYGAFQLRKLYASHTFKAFVFTLLFLLSGASIPLIAEFIGDITEPKIAFKSTEIILMDLPDQPKKEEIIQIEERSVAAATPTTRFTEFRIVPTDEIVETPPAIDELANTTIGTATTIGDPNEVVPLDILQDNYNNPIEESTEDPVLFVDEMPEFIGGDAALFKYILNEFNYPAIARENQVVGTVYLNFVIEKDGSITQVGLADPNRIAGAGCDEEAIRVISKMPHWKPGKQNGRARRVQCTIPIKLNLL